MGVEGGNASPEKGTPHQGHLASLFKLLVTPMSKHQGHEPSNLEALQSIGDCDVRESLTLGHEPCGATSPLMSIGGARAWSGSRGGSLESVRVDANLVNSGSESVSSGPKTSLTVNEIESVEADAPWGPCLGAVTVTGTSATWSAALAMALVHWVKV